MDFARFQSIFFFQFYSTSNFTLSSARIHFTISPTFSAASFPFYFNLSSGTFAEPKRNIIPIGSHAARPYDGRSHGDFTSILPVDWLNGENFTLHALTPSWQKYAGETCSDLLMNDFHFEQIFAMVVSRAHDFLRLFALSAHSLRIASSQRRRVAGWS